MNRILLTATLLGVTLGIIGCSGEQPEQPVVPQPDRPVAEQPKQPVVPETADAPAAAAPAVGKTEPTDDQSEPSVLGAVGRSLLRSFTGGT